MKKLFFSLLVLSFCLTVSNAEYFYLKSGEAINGKIISEKNDSVTISVAGTGVKKTIMLYDIDEISASPRAVAAVVSKTVPDADEAKTQFTSEFKQEKAEGETYIKDNESGVLVFNVQETVVEKPKPVQSEPAVQDEEEFDAALFLLGGGNDNNTNNETAVPFVVVEEIEVDVPASEEDITFFKENDSRRKEKKNKKNNKKEKTSLKEEDDYYDPALFVIEEQEDYVSGAPEMDIKKDKPVSVKPDPETFLAISFDLQGRSEFSGDVKQNGIKSSADNTEDTDYGISLSLEQYGYVSRLAAVGLGIGFQFKRCLDESPGRFGFLPIYGAFKMRFISEENYHLYAVAHLGFNFLFATSDYADKEKIGLYYAGGLGASYNRYVFQVLYSVNNSSLKFLDRDIEFDKDVMYSKVGFYIGYLF